ncbi:hypothetical protein A9K55_005322 [Cordyceps militaris]|uniref:Uncharacterized protein n=1 Tax=Cordyceps militaris TaxID=73501 RepID=A0A2H4SPC1_CORMI|nr:hypothetical protein A9K55_005322 [Cordyceps militaris]
MSTLAELESEFERLTAILEAAKYEHDPAMTEEKRIVLACKHRAVHTELFAARKEAAAAQTSSAPEPELVGIPTLAQLESKYKEFEQMLQVVKSDLTISNDRRRDMSIERLTLRSELIAARREAKAAKQNSA